MSSGGSTCGGESSNSAFLKLRWWSAAFVWLGKQQLRFFKSKFYHILSCFRLSAKHNLVYVDLQVRLQGGGALDCFVQWRVPVPRGGSVCWDFTKSFIESPSRPGVDWRHGAKHWFKHFPSLSRVLCRHYCTVFCLWREFFTFLVDNGTVYKVFTNSAKKAPHVVEQFDVFEVRRFYFIN